MTTCAAAIPTATLDVNTAHTQKPVLPFVIARKNRYNDKTKATATSIHHNGFCHRAPIIVIRYAIAPPTVIPPIAGAIVGLNRFAIAIIAVIPTIKITLINHNFLLDVFTFFPAKGHL